MNESTSNTESRESKITAVKRIGIFSVLIFLGACTTGNSVMPNFNFGNGGWQNKDGLAQSDEFTAPRDPEVLADGNDIQVAIYNAIELARKKRFEKARHLLAMVRELQAPETEGYQAITCAMAIVSLRAGDVTTFKRTARQLDKSIGEPVKVPASYVEVISLYRMLTQQSLPVNTPDEMQRLKEQHFEVTNNT